MNEKMTRLLVAYARMFGYVVTICMHVGNMMFLKSCMDSNLSVDENLKVFAELQPRFFTCWNFFLHVVFSVVGLISDTKLILNFANSQYRPSKYFEGFKRTLFSAIVWPSTWVVVIVFWPLFLYDRNLIFPPFADNVITSLSNHIMHTAIGGSVLWEVCFQPRDVPSKHIFNILHLIGHLVLYFVILILTYIERGVWIYPIFRQLYGTIYFPIAILSIGLFAIGSYYAQWYLTVLIWGRRQGTKKIR